MHRSQGTSTKRRVARTLALAGLAAAVAVVAAAPASAAVTWVVKGRGWGHGVGMSQWGARGLAANGQGHRSILEHYYRNSNVIRRSKGQGLRILLDRGDRRVRFTRARRACDRRLNPNRRYVFQRKGLRVLLRNDRDRRLRNCGREGKAWGGRAVRIGGQGLYRGRLVARAESDGLLEINKVRLEAYLKGVVPKEMFPSWPSRALRAQAVAARSFALATRRSGPFDHFDDTRSQVYGGKAAETRPTNRAVADTKGELVKHGGEVATTFFFSTSGGRTENVEYGFVGNSPLPYLRSVNDPFDDASPQHRWRVKLSQSQMSSRLSRFFSGRLKRIEVTKRGRSPRIVRARVVGSKGSSKVTGPQLRAAIGLRSTWARFDKRR